MRIASLAAPVLAALGLAIALAPAAPRAEPIAEIAAVIGAPLSLDAHKIKLGGALRAPEAWTAYKKRFIAEQGRVIDTANDQVSHSEGQGYAMLLAVAANDRATFDRLWGWTRANLMVRNDELVAWRFDPQRRPAVGDMNNASDGDLLIAWALAEAAEYWDDLPLRMASRRIAVELSRKVVLFKTRMGALLLPAVAGFNASDRSDGPVINLSYYVFPALARLDSVAPEVDWAGLTQTGLDLLEASRPTPQTLPADWIALEGWRARPAEGFAPEFAYNAVRIPLYLAWAGVGERAHYAPFLAWAQRAKEAPPIVDVASGKEVGQFGGNGIASIAALVACVVDGAKLPADFAAPKANEDYYPATLHLLALLAAQMRYSSCLAK
ncbi:endoglucanase [Methylosinus sp. sav-2]|uniref:glycosyl hydrolase family 8 n=1 Tax=Methylosinus sp. sav-2 TaxID=2485168 RepID=UPI00047DA7A8|nr:glycosyl hydrolase family 8 [Methylosinus sp. sav-2]TDX66786.1 endoglucanase [Methylosinus sp. sav-2]